MNQSALWIEPESKSNQWNQTKTNQSNVLARIDWFGLISGLIPAQFSYVCIMLPQALLPLIAANINSVSFNNWLILIQEIESNQEINEFKTELIE